MSKHSTMSLWGNTLIIFGLLLLGSMVSCSGDDDDPGNKESPSGTSSFPCTLSASPETGSIPLNVSFTGSASVDDATIVKYEIDFDGNGTYDFTSNTTTLNTNHTYTAAGVYQAKMKVTDSKGRTSESTKTITTSAVTYTYSGFKDLAFFKTVYWSYKWEHSSKPVGGSTTTTSGYVIIALNDTYDASISYTGAGTLSVFKRADTKGTYPLPWTTPNCMAIKNGIIYFITEGSNQPYAAFNAQTGKSGATGFTGVMSEKYTKTVSATNIVNEFNPSYSGQGVVVTENAYKAMCETIAGQTICGTEAFDFIIKEYYLPDVGFCGMTRTGTYTSGSGMYSTTINQTTKLWLEGSTIKLGPPTPYDPNSTSWTRYTSEAASINFTLKTGQSLSEANWTEIIQVETAWDIYSKIKIYNATGGNGKVELTLASNSVTTEYNYTTIATDKLYIASLNRYIDIFDTNVRLSAPATALQSMMSPALFNKFSDVSIYAKYVKAY